MARQDRNRDEDLAEVARERNRHLSGETAKGRVDPAAAGGRAKREKTSGGGDTSGKGTGNVRGTEGMPRSGADLGDRSTGGEAAREAIGADPAESGGETKDRSTGKSTRKEMFGDEEKS
ncbi:hypothetical protein F0L17_06655 [Streptomyces sp. TRM43335]|uniref:Uncharacterized protein n=1 Tax=Streptomyces taklimakanensis TaxID=2569853 RepID=A0A6G2B9R9_9ACTN|nr:hypothetical protein [Streptomyces taklimakanensis]MTE18819.1 hypothetical protein [Streptomyces taklimakanensis]